MTPEQYRYLIAELAETVKANGGSMKIHDAEIATARRLGISVADMTGIPINAHADRVLVMSYRSGTLSLP